LRKRWKRIRGSLKNKRQQEEFNKAQQKIIELKKLENEDVFDIVYRAYA